MNQHQIVLKLAPPGSKVYASAKFVCGLFVSSLSVEGQIPNNHAHVLVTRRSCADNSPDGCAAVAGQGLATFGNV